MDKTVEVPIKWLEGLVEKANAVENMAYTGTEVNTLVGYAQSAEGLINNEKSS